jgi:hypothetical protein
MGTVKNVLHGISGAKGVDGYHNFLETDVLCPMCVLMYLDGQT